MRERGERERDRDLESERERQQQHVEVYNVPSSIQDSWIKIYDEGPGLGGQPYYFAFWFRGLHRVLERGERDGYMTARVDCIKAEPGPIRAEPGRAETAGTNRARARACPPAPTPMPAAAGSGQRGGGGGTGAAGVGAEAGPQAGRPAERSGLVASRAGASGDGGWPGPAVTVCWVARGSP